MTSLALIQRPAIICNVAPLKMDASQSLKRGNVSLVLVMRMKMMLIVSEWMCLY